MDEQQFVQLLEGLLQRKLNNAASQRTTDKTQPTLSVSSLPPLPSTSNTTARPHLSMLFFRFSVGILSPSCASWPLSRLGSL
jgi:hypothetical protein